jgi:hypothetical protein
MKDLGDLLSGSQGSLNKASGAGIRLQAGSVPTLTEQHGCELCLIGKGGLTREKAP